MFSVCEDTGRGGKFFRRNFCFWGNELFCRTKKRIMKNFTISSFIFLLLISACGESTETTTADSDNNSSQNNSSDSVVEQWKNEIAGRILQYYYGDNMYHKAVTITLCTSGIGNYYKEETGGIFQYNFNWHIENSEQAGPILYLDSDDINRHESFNLTMENGSVYLNGNRYLRRDEEANCN